MDADAARRADSAQVGAVAGGPLDELGEHRLLGQNFLLAVDIVEKGPERAQALLEAALEPAPVVLGDEARQQAERKDLFGAARVAVDRERDPLLEQGVLGQGLGAGKAFGADRVQELGYPGKRRAWRSRRLEQLVERAGERGVAL